LVALRLALVALPLAVLALAVTPAAPANPVGVQVGHFSIVSHQLHQTTTQTAVTPAGGSTGRPLLVFLHGT
jgi:hypothetical protein